ncbi:hypothetical protein DUNSADRAFT_10992 [Dunaliella salina]|uniref:SET domain-containing protein n=1 Tax=Dunaliella salina TaxID=3046 RepID=A0ABQ7GEA9_DUNSA|nr:hypothetical protein DUNSADRAFT_10992 [Dunaliella salina]|eukprot:KAF5832946.1 hypothetical protein DUNSADRAFT_10992 [Dunaliella salina]
MEIFPLEGPGWGVRALQHIHAGDFLMEYVGEIIATHSSEMEDREKWYGKMGWSYCYDAERDEESQHLEKTIDATHLGNASRLVNHSCSPNVQVVHVCQGQIERSLLLLFQATRDIEPNEEITISYQTGEMFEGKEREGGGLKDMFDADPDDPALIKCCCGARNCRKVVLSHDYQLDEMHGASIDAFEAHKQGGKSMPLASSCDSKYRAIPRCSSRQGRKEAGSEHRRDSRQQVGRAVRGFASVQQEGRDAEGRDTASGIQPSMGNKRQRIKEAQDMSAVEPVSSRASEGNRPEEEEGSREPLRILESVSLGRDATVSQPSAGGKQQQIKEAHAMGAVRPQSRDPGVTAAGSRFSVGCRQQEVVECMDLSHNSTESSSPKRGERGGEPAPGHLLHQQEVIEILDDDEDSPGAAMPVTIDLTHDDDD